MVKNLVYNSKVIAKVSIADSFTKRFLGYMFQKEPQQESILFKPCNSIHTFFMKFDIDVLFIDENFQVVNKIENLKGGKIIIPQEKAKMVIEGKVGVFKEVKVGSKIEIMT